LPKMQPGTVVPWECTKTDKILVDKNEVCWPLWLTTVMLKGVLLVYFDICRVRTAEPMNIIHFWNKLWKNIRLIIYSWKSNSIYHFTTTIASVLKRDEFSISARSRVIYFFSIQSVIIFFNPIPTRGRDIPIPTRDYE
jgi:hypothetical protein